MVIGIKTLKTELDFPVELQEVLISSAVLAFLVLSHLEQDIISKLSIIGRAQ